MKIKNLIVLVTFLTAMTLVVAAEISGDEVEINRGLSGETVHKLDEKPINPGYQPEQVTPDKNPQAQRSTRDLLTFILEQGPNDMRASELVGMPVFGVDGTQIADISDLVLNPDHQVTAVVMTSGGILGVGGKRIALSMDDLVIAQGSSKSQRSALVNLTEQDVVNAPEFHIKGAGFLTVISTTPLVNRTEGGDLNYRFRFITNGCPKIQPVNATDDEVYIF